MRKLTAVVLVCMLVLLALAGCAGQSANAPANTSSGGNASGGGVTLAQMKAAAQSAGYPVTDDYVAWFMAEVTGGFTVEVGDTVYSILECGTEQAAIDNAKEIDDAGYNIAIRTGKIVACYGVDDDASVKDILTSILAGDPVPNE